MNELEQSLHQFQALPTPQSFRLINFDSAEIRQSTVAGTFILIVKGIKPYLNMEVNLMPLTYIQQPEYWGIEVIGSLPGIGLPAESPYTVCISLEGIRGTKGIEVIGATQSKQLPLSEILPPQIFKTWINSFEEDEQDSIVYRPEGFPFPPARFREKLIFKRNGEFILTVPGANDVPEEIQGTWESSVKDKILVQFPNSRREGFILHIIEINEEILKVRKFPIEP